VGHSLSHGNYFFLAENISMQEMEYVFLKACGMYLYMLPLGGGLYTEASGRREENHMHFESWFYCFILVHRVNMDQRPGSIVRLL
jgi:hypothetical protein